MEMEAKRKRKRKKLFIAVAAVLLIYAATMLIPMYFVIVNSLKRPSQFYENPWTLPKVLYLANYRSVFQLSVGEVSIFRMYINSIIFTVASTLISCAATTVTAYTVARFDFRGKGLLVSIGIGAMLIPDLGSRSVVYKMYVDLNMIDTWFILIQYATPFGMMFLITYSLFKTVSKTYAEAAKIDGANEFHIYWYVVLPMCLPVLVTLAIFSFQGNWNDYVWPLIVTNSAQSRTLTAGLATFSGSYAHQYGKQMAGAVLSALPILLIFVLGQKYFIKGIAIGGIKG